MTGCAQPVGGERIADVPELRFRRPAVPVDDLRTELLGAETCVGLGFLAAQPVVHVQRGDAIAKRQQHVPEAGRVGPAGDEHCHLAVRRNQLVAADELLDARR